MYLLNPHLKPKRAGVTLGSVLLEKVLLQTKSFHSLLGFSELLQTHLDIEVLRRWFAKGPLFLRFFLRPPAAGLCAFKED